VLVDPRIQADGITQSDLADQLTLSLQVRDALSQARAAAVQITEAKEDFAEGRDAEAIKTKLSEIEQKLVTASGHRYPQPMLIDQIEYLYENLDRADQKPGADSYKRFENLEAALSSHIRELEQLLATTTDEDGN
jgi:uncharacterized coiled-coil DUF342 family protein